MSKYLIAANYTLKGLEGVRAKGAASRVDAIRATVEGMGGSLESFHFAFGDTDVFVLAEMPDDKAAAAVAFAVSSAGGATTRTTKLLTPAEVDAALALGVDYRPPGA